MPSITQSSGQLDMESLGTGQWSPPIMSGNILKKVGWMTYKVRFMVLYGDKIVYYAPSKDVKLVPSPLLSKFQGEIPIVKSLVIEQEDKKRFAITAPKKKYFFKVPWPCHLQP